MKYGRILCTVYCVDGMTTVGIKIDLSIVLYCEIKLESGAYDGIDVKSVPKSTHSMIGKL